MPPFILESCILYISMYFKIQLKLLKGNFLTLRKLPEYDELTRSPFLCKLKAIEF